MILPQLAALDEPGEIARAAGVPEADVIAEAHLDPDSIFAGVQRFAQERPTRLSRQHALLNALG